MSAWGRSIKSNINKVIVNYPHERLGAGRTCWAVHGVRSIQYSVYLRDRGSNLRLVVSCGFRFMFI